MKNQLALPARSLTPLFIGFLFWSWGGAAGWRTLQLQAMPYPQLQAFQEAVGKKPLPRRQWNKLAPAQKQNESQRAKLDLSNRLGEAVRDPERLTRSDLAAVKAAWGDESARLLAILRDSSH